MKIYITTLITRKPLQVSYVNAHLSESEAMKFLVNALFDNDCIDDSNTYLQTFITERYTKFEQIYDLCEQFGDSFFTDKWNVSVNVVERE